jgi:hypothetical protein
LRSASAKPTGIGKALAERTGGGLDARGEMPYSGWPAVLEPSWRKFLIWSIVMSS